jgi:YD repeat-containing protein
VCLDAIAPQVDRIVLIDNSDDGSAGRELEKIGGPVDNLHTILAAQQPPNLSRLWNLGLEHASTDHRMDYDPEGYRIAVLNDDAIVPQHWFDIVVTAMETYGCAAGGYGSFSSGGPAVHRVAGTTRLDRRLPGYAFILDGSYGLRADEQLQWWCGDNDLDMQAREAAGTVILPGDPVRHLYPDQSTTGVLAARTAEDMRLFVQKWGFRPW